MHTQEIIENYKAVIVQIATSFGTGTGFYVRDFNLIVTNDHASPSKDSGQMKSNN